MEQIENKGQLLLIGGVLIAAVIIGTSVTVNSLEFSQSNTLESNEEESESILLIESTQRALVGGMSGTGGTPADASNAYDEYTESYGNSVLNLSLASGSTVSVSTGSKTGAWAVGQREKSPFTNATDDGTWVVSEGVSDVYSAWFNVSMSSVTPNSYRMNVSTTDSSITPTDPITGGWYMELSESGGDLEINGAGYGGGSPPPSLPKTVTPEGGYAEFKIEFSGVDALRYESGSDVEGKYDLRFDGSSSISGPCPAAPCKGGDAYEKYAVGVLHEIEDVDINYRKSGTEYEQRIDSLKLKPNRANTDTTSVYGSAYLDVEVSSNNSPIDAGNNVDIGYKVENTGDEDSASEPIELVIRSNGTDKVEASGSVSPDSGNTATGTLSWSTDFDDKGAYTVLLRTEDTTESLEVAVKNSGAGIDPGPVGMYTVGDYIER
jgi:hypothetical protein